MFGPKMFEITVFCIVIIASAYWAFLWRMGRRDDVLHGEFIAPFSSSSSFSSSSPFSSPGPFSNQRPASTLDIEVSVKSLLRTIERDLCESGN
jgi:hypothetical protein